MDDAWKEHFDHATVYDDILPDDADILRAIAKIPIMLERPILACGARAVIGRPPERVLTLLDGPKANPADAAKLAAALEGLSAAATAAHARGVPGATLERSLLRMAAEMHMMQP